MFEKPGRIRWPPGFFRSVARLCETGRGGRSLPRAQKGERSMLTGESQVLADVVPVP